MSGPGRSISRRDALARVSALFGAFVATPAGWRRIVREPFPHPEPRPGVTAERVLPVSELGTRKRVLDAYATAREHPALFDGLYCVCRCEEEHRSLLACFESQQATGCMGCMEQAELVGELVKQGKGLGDIRKAFDEKWG